MRTTPPNKSPRPSFRDYTPKQGKRQVHLERASFEGAAPEDATEVIAGFLEDKRDYRAVTLRQKRVVVRRILTDFKDRGLDLASVSADDVAAYRLYLKDLVDAESISESYAAHIVSQWNSVMRAVFGEPGEAGEGLIMRGFQQHPRRVQHVTEDEFAALLRATKEKPFASEHYREAFETYLELAWSTGARIGSMLDERLRVADIDWEHQTVRFRHMKNVPEHTAVLTDRAAFKLREWILHLRDTTCWRGETTPVFVGATGKPLTPQWVNNTLKAVAARAGITKPITSHTIRKSVGTLIGRENPKFAQLQLGITARIFNEHYNQPLLEDRLKRRDLLPGAGWRPRTPEEIAGHAYLEYSRGRLSKQDLEAQVELARSAKAQPNIAAENTPGYV